MQETAKSNWEIGAVTHIHIHIIIIYIPIHVYIIKKEVNKIFGLPCDYLSNIDIDDDIGVGGGGGLDLGWTWAIPLESTTLIRQLGTPSSLRTTAASWNSHSLQMMLSASANLQISSRVACVISIPPKPTCDSTLFTHIIDGDGTYLYQIQYLITHES